MQRADEQRAGKLLGILSRVVVPLWLLAGALSKLVEASPSSLPVALIRWAGAAGIDLGFVHAFGVGVELTAVGVMVLLPGLAPLAAGTMLAIFLPVLVGDILLGASSCGCFGSVSVHPGVTLAVDATLLAALVLAVRRVRWRLIPASLPGGRTAVALAWSVLAFALAFGWGAVGTAPAGAAEGEGVVTEQAAPPLPDYYLPDYPGWIGKRWEELDVTRWITGAAPSGRGVEYVIFYRKDCEHCHTLFETWLAGGVPDPVLLVAVPDRDGFPESGFPVPCDACARAELPSGCDWFFQTPAVVRLRDGVVECAAEVDPMAPECLEWAG